MKTKLLLLNILLLLFISTVYSLEDTGNIGNVNIQNQENSNNIAQERIISTNCVDSDNGIEIYTKGQVQSSTALSIDSCIDFSNTLSRGGLNSNLIEYSCNSENTISNIVQCNNGCYDGACIENINTAIQNNIFSCELLNETLCNRASIYCQANYINKGFGLLREYKNCSIKLINVQSKSISEASIASNPTCIDSDGDTKNIKGSAQRLYENVLGAWGPVDEFCLDTAGNRVENGDLINEFTCPDQNGNVIGTPFRCEYGCSNGACNSAPVQVSNPIITNSTNSQTIQTVNNNIFSKSILVFNGCSNTNLNEYCPKGTITSCVENYKGPGGTFITISGPNCDLRADPPVLKHLGPIQSDSNMIYLDYLYMILGGRTSYPVGGNCYQDVVWFDTTSSSKLECNDNNPSFNAYAKCNSHCCYSNVKRYYQKCE